MRPSAAAAFRPLVSHDARVVRLLVTHEVSGTPYTAIVEYFLGLALEGRSEESRGLVAEHDTDVIGVVLFGEVAGSVGTGRIHFVTVSASARLNAIGSALCDAAVADLAASGNRLAVAEVPDDRRLTSGIALLARCGFREVGRVADYYRDGTDLVILARSLGRPE